MDAKNILNEARSLNKRYNFFITINESFLEEPFLKKASGKNAKPSGKNYNEKVKLISVKDNICTKGLRTTAGSKILDNYVPVFDATVIEKIKGKYGVVGKTAMDEFGFGSFSTNCAFNVPKNPLDETRTCGGSSGGGAGYTYLSKYSDSSIGESTGGSISCPAAFCSVVGITPTYGLVSRYGLIDYANSLDKIGTFGKTVKDAVKLLNHIAGYDKKDSTSIKKTKEDYEKYLGKNSKLKIGIIKEFSNGEGISKEVEKEFWNGVKKLENEGMNYDEISFSLTDVFIPTYYIIAMSEASTNLAKYSGIRYGASDELKGTFNEYFSHVRSNNFGKEAKRRILLGTFMRMAGYRNAFYIKALKIRSLIINEYKKLLKNYDVFPKFSEIEKLSPVEAYMSDLLTVGPNLAGLPMISVPVKKDRPIGMHFIADHLQENKIIQIGDFYERIR
ncbi:Asp-tRNA(Asn)/Glu-tRNA(Gln) amidotransferase subunit GatA [Candidatus Woesearchaeota archaeon]|nr:Asp-tRNA(Asn)/Glu-tRNA(Gln) amidotransferase subunit GatA [Candidatus Woesearchaeota archaeon]